MSKICRTEAMDELELLVTKKRFKLTPGEASALDVAIKALEQDPKTGHWIKLPYMAIEADGTLIFSYQCSFCKGISYFRRSEGKIVGGLFCPNCGAKMEG